MGEPNAHVDISLDLTILTSCSPESASTSVSQESTGCPKSWSGRPVRASGSRWREKKQKIERASLNVQNRTSVLEEEKQASFTLQDNSKYVGRVLPNPGQPPGNQPPRPRPEPTQPKQEPSLGTWAVDTKGRVYWVICLETRKGNTLPQE